MIERRRTAIYRRSKDDRRRAVYSRTDNFKYFSKGASSEGVGEQEGLRTGDALDGGG